MEKTQELMKYPRRGRQDGIKIQIKWLALERSSILFLGGKKEVGKMNGNKTWKVDGMEVVDDFFFEVRGYDWVWNLKNME